MRIGPPGSSASTTWPFRVTRTRPATARFAATLRIGAINARHPGSSSGSKARATSDGQIVACAARASINASIVAVMAASRTMPSAAASLDPPPSFDRIDRNRTTHGLADATQDLRVVLA